jgi:hypothetical protein
MPVGTGLVRRLVARLPRLPRLPRRVGQVEREQRSPAEDGRLRAVVDFGTPAVGDHARDARRTP